MKNQIKTIVLLGALSALLAGIGGALAPRYLWVFTVLALGMNHPPAEERIRRLRAMSTQARRGGFGGGDMARARGLVR